jgi:hypothetical protein
MSEEIIIEALRDEESNPQTNVHQQIDFLPIHFFCLF